MTKVYLDSSYSIILIDYTYLRIVLPNVEIKKILVLILVYSIRNKIIKINKYTLIRIYILGTINRITSKALIIIEVYIVNNLKVNLLINNNTLKP